MKVVSNTSPLIGLAKIGRLDILEQLRSFSRRLDRGESEVLTLALQEEADFVILDDRKAFSGKMVAMR